MSFQNFREAEFVAAVVPPAVRIPVSAPYFGFREVEFVADAIKNKWVSRGPYCARFEAALRDRTQRHHALTCTSGTTALHLAMRGLNLQPGDEVLVPDLTYVATANAVSYCGAKPVPVEVDPDFWTIDPEAVKQAITPHTVGIIPVHLYGGMADMVSLAAIAQEHDLWVVEDAAEAFGATFRDLPAGSFGTAATFSFYANKTITTGEGGALVTNDVELFDRAKFLWGQAQGPERYFHPEVGFNYRMTDLQAALGCAQLELLHSILKRRREVWNRYASELGKHVHSQAVRPETEHGAWMFVAVFDSLEQKHRVEFRLTEAGIETRPVFVPMTGLPMYQDYARANTLASTSWRLYSRGLCLPTHAVLTDEQQSEVIEIVRAAC